MSLRRRLVAGLVAVAAVLILTNVALSRTIEGFLLQRVDEQLVEVASRPVLRGDRGPRRGPATPADETLSEYFIAVGNPSDGTLTQLPTAFLDSDRPPPRLTQAQVLQHLTPPRSVPVPFTAEAQTGSGEWRLVAIANSGLGGVTVVGVSLDEVAQTVRRVRVVQVAGTLAALGALGLVSFWMLRLGVHPIEDMARTADAIAAGDLSQRVDHPGEETEAGRLGVALNSMLERIEDAFRAREASEARVRRFAADASHELRTPLTSIQGYAELWRAGALRSDEELAEAMRRMEQEAKRMGALVEDLLLLARLDQHRPLERAPVQLDAIAADAVQDAKAVEPERPISCEADAEVVVQGDEMRLRQVVANLVTNARVHTPPGTPVVVRVSNGGGVARLEVADQGPGMDEEVAAKVFERFFRADASRGRSGGGTGLGLAIVEAVAQAHGGRARVESAPGEGSRFIVELPLLSPAP
jgi:two-component system, OmpR family, sensor kinase